MDKLSFNFLSQEGTVDFHERTHILIFISETLSYLKAYLALVAAEHDK